MLAISPIAGPLFVALALLPNPAAYAPGDVVAVIEDGTGIKVGDKVIERVGRGFTATVHKAAGDWLWVTHGQPGWLRREKVLPLNEARAYFDAQIRARPGDAGAYHARGLVLLELGEPAAALKDFDRAVQLDPANAAYHGNRGRARLEAGDPARALEDLNAAIRLQPHARHYNNRGVAHRLSGNHDQALADHNEALRLDPAATYALLNRGLIRRQRGEFALAAADLRAAVKLDPFDPESANNLAWLEATCPDAAQRNPAEAIRLATVACELTHRKEPVCLDTLATAYASAGQFEKAVATEKQALELTEDPAAREPLRQRLELFRAGNAFREEK